MNPWLGILGLFAGVGVLAFSGHKQINRLDNEVSRIDNGIRATPVAQQYLQARFPGSFIKG